MILQKDIVFEPVRQSGYGLIGHQVLAKRSGCMGFDRETMARYGISEDATALRVGLTFESVTPESDEVGLYKLGPNDLCIRRVEMTEAVSRGYYLFGEPPTKTTKTEYSAYLVDHRNHGEPPIELHIPLTEEEYMEMKELPHDTFMRLVDIRPTGVDDSFKKEMMMGY